MFECSGIYNTNNIIFLGAHYKPRQMLNILPDSSRIAVCLSASGINNINNIIPYIYISRERKALVGKQVFVHNKMA